jgi:hypothetical protein
MRGLFIFFALLIIIDVQALNAQIKNLHGVSNIIPDSLVKEKSVGGITVKFLQEKYLKEGWNEFSHKPGGFVYISYKSEKIRAYYLSDTTAAVLAGAFFSADTQSIDENCFGGSCFCNAEKNCAALFTANKEKSDIVCVGNSCFFTRPFDAQLFKKEYQKKLKEEANAAPCNQAALTTLDFTAKKVFLSALAKENLDNLFTTISKNNCRIEVVAYDVNCMICQQVSWDRTYSVYKYLLGKGIDSSRFILRYEGGANPQVVTIRQSVDWDYPVLPEPPMPCFSYHGLTKKRCRGAAKISP